MRSVGKRTADFIAINKCGSDVGSSTFIQYEARAKRSHAQNKQCHNHLCHSVFRVVAYRLAVGVPVPGTSFGDPGCTLNIDIKVILISFICLNMWVNITVLGLKPGTKIAAKTGNPAGLLFRRIWYSVGKSGVLGITEYRQGRPLTTLPRLSMLTGAEQNRNGDAH